MATFKATIFKHRQRPDKTWNVVIRFTHDRKIRYISTTMYVAKQDITSSFKIKNRQILDKCEDMIRNYRKRVNELNLEFNDMDIDNIIDYMKKKKSTRGISFSDFAEKWLERHTEIKGIRNYKTALNAFYAYKGRKEVLCTEVNIETMKAFEESLKDRPRAQSLYPNAIKTIFNAAREFYNDEDNNIIRIKHSLQKYKPCEQNVAEKRALEVELIRDLFALPYDGIKVKGKSSLHDLSLDCFRLSFCLMGMNSADLYDISRIEDNMLIYERMKTRDRRSDKAEIRVEITPYIEHLIKKYKGKDRIFNFSERFASMQNFNRAINLGLKQVGKELRIEKLQFYAARHSMATIAVNDVEISKYIVNDMLNHTDPTLKVTELYIKRSFKIINTANRKLLDFVLGEKS